MRSSLYAFLLGAVVVLGLSSPQIAVARPSVAPASPFFVTYDGVAYHADSLSTSSSYAGTLKAVIQSAVSELNTGGGGTIEFAAGTFDYGNEYFKGDQVHNIVFEGQGIDVTYIQNWSSDVADTEPFNFSGAFGITIRDLTVSAGGPVRLTSDALDFDEGNDSLVERVKITASRGRGIVFDGKNAGWTSVNNVIRDCIIDGVADSGVEFLASSSNLIEGCTITDVGRHGIEAGKSSATASQPNKKSNDNVIRDNVIDNAGVDGININASDGNRIQGNLVTNSSNTVTSADGIRISSSDSITCDDNVVDANVATDTQATKTQRYGLNIASALCNRTVVEGTNDFTGNRVGAINDLGTGTQYGVDSVPPRAPSALSAVGAYKTRIDLFWTAAVDGVGVTAYEVWRDGSALETIGAETNYSDAAVTPGSTHSYQVRALDAAGNVSGFSNIASATTPTGGILFHDGFETGDFSNWTSASGIVVQEQQSQQEAFAGVWAARAAGANTAAFATKHLSVSESDLYWRVHFKVSSQSTNANLLRFRTSAGASILTAFVSTADKIGYRNDSTGISTTSTTTAVRGSWHTLQVHVSINGGAGQVEVWLDGARIDALSTAQSLGTNPIGRLELGDNSTTHTYDVALDDVDYDLELMPDAGPPTAPSNLLASSSSGFRVDLTWAGSRDDTGVTAYEIFRNGAGTPIGTTSGTVTSYTDTTGAPLTSYSYTVRAKDAAGHASALSNTASATTVDAFADAFETGDLSRWTGVSGLVVQQSVVDGGQWAAAARTDGTAGASAQVQLGSTVSELYYKARIRIESQGTNSVSLLRFRTAQNAALASAFVSSVGVLAYRNDTNAAVTTSGQTVAPGIWHEIQMHVLVADTASNVDVWLDGIRVITQVDSLGTSSIGRLELGDPSLGRSFDVVIDTVVADPVFIPDTATPTAPPNLRSTRVGASEVHLAWDAADDDVGITTYRVWRDGNQVAEVGGSTLAFTDTGLQPVTPYVYTVTALDAAGRESALSDQLEVTTTRPTAACWPFRSPPPLPIRRCR